MDDTKKIVVVTGGAGFIGSRLCELLVEKGEKVVCVDNFVTGTIENISHLFQNENFKLIKHDLSLPIDLNSFGELAVMKVQSLGVKQIYHLACPTAHQEFAKLHLETAISNSIVVKNALDMAVQYKSSFLFVSSSAIYGDPLPDTRFFKEDYWGYVDPLGVRAPYNEGKRFAECLVSAYVERHGIEGKIARLFSAYGPRLRKDDGRMIPEFFKAAKEGTPLQILGDDSAKVSWCYIDDIVDGLMRLMTTSVPFGPVNFGDDQGTSLGDVAREILSQMHSSSTLAYEKAPEALSYQGLPDISKARELLGWFPIVTLKEGLGKTIQYLNAEHSSTL